MQEMELSSFIKDLLFQHDCVIVPDFGGFVANYRPAGINYNLNTFSPPGKDISFNRSLINNDGLLIGHISEVTGMSYVDAKNWVSGRVKEWKRKLEKGKKTELDDIGVFQMGKDRNLLFEPVNSVNFLVDAFGLSDFQFVPLETFEKSKITGKIIKEKKEHLRSNKTLRRVLVAVPIVAVLALVPLKMNWINIPVDFSSFNPFGHSRNISAVHVTVPEQKESKSIHPVIKGPTLKTPATEETKAVPSDVKITKPVNKQEVGKKTTVVQQRMYYIVAGSFKNKVNAKILKEQLIQEKFPVVILKGPNGFSRVAIGGYADKQTAIKILKEQEVYPDGKYYWLLKY